jgi:site-specific recombinase XerD
MLEIKEYLDNLALDKSAKTIENYELSVGKFVDYFHIQTIEDMKNITPSKCREYQGALLKTVGKSSVNAYIRPLKAMYNWFIQNEYLDKSPFDKVEALKLEKKLPVYLSDSEITAMVKACDSLVDRLIFILLISMGLRRDELVNIKLNDIVGDHILINGKGSKQRNLQIQPEVSDLLDEYIEYRNKRYGDDSEYLLISTYSNSKFSGEAIRLKIKKIATDAGIDPERIEKLSPHKMRHTYAANMLESGADIKILQEGLGHASIATTSGIYAHVRSAVLDKAMMNQKSYL